MENCGPEEKTFNFPPIFTFQVGDWNTIQWESKWPKTVILISKVLLLMNSVKYQLQSIMTVSIFVDKKQNCYPSFQFKTYWQKISNASHMFERFLYLVLSFYLWLKLKHGENQTWRLLIHPENFQLVFLELANITVLWLLLFFLYPGHFQEIIWIVLFLCF